MSHNIIDTQDIPDFFRTVTGSTVPSGVNDTTEAITRTGMVFAKGFKAESGLPVPGVALTPQPGFFFNGTEGDGGMHSFPGTDSSIGFATDGNTRAILRTSAGLGAWALNAGTIAQAQAIDAHHYVRSSAGARIASQINIATAGSAVAQENGISLLLTNENKTNTTGLVGSIVATDAASPFGPTGAGAKIEFNRRGSSTNNNLSVLISTMANEGMKGRFVVDEKGRSFHDCDTDTSSFFFGVLRGGVYAFNAQHNGSVFQLNAVVPWTTASDERYKDSIAAIDKATAKAVVMGLKPSSWNWSQEAQDSVGLKGSSQGFVAQQVREFAPEVVTTIDEAGHLGISESKMIPYLWAQVQTLTELVDRLTLQNLQLQE